MSTLLEVWDGIVSGRPRSAVNRSRDAKGSIHDATAARLGFRAVMPDKPHRSSQPVRFSPDWSPR